MPYLRKIDLEGDVAGHMPYRKFDEGTPVTLVLENGEEVKAHTSLSGKGEGDGELVVEIPDGVDIEDQRITVRFEDGDEVQGHRIKFK